MEQTGKTHNSCEEFKIWEVIWTNIKERKYNAKGHHLVYLIGLFSTFDSSCAFLSLSFFFFFFTFSMQVFNLITERIIYALTDVSNFLDGDSRNLIWT